MWRVHDIRFRQGRVTPRGCVVTYLFTKRCKAESCFVVRSWFVPPPPQQTCLILAGQV